MTIPVHSMWKKIQSEVSSWPVENIRNHPIIRHWLLSVGDPTVEDLLWEARLQDPSTYDALIGRLTESKIISRGSSELSKKTACQFYHAMRIISEFPLEDESRIVEIGGGIGNLARIFISLNLCKNYRILDISVIHEFQRFFLQNSLNPREVGRVELLNMEVPSDYFKAISGDSSVVVSTFALTEVPQDAADVYIEQVINRADYVYIVGQMIFKGEPTGRHIIDSLSENFTLKIEDYCRFYVSDRESFELVGKRRRLAE